MPPKPAAMWGTRAPTAKKRVATAMPIWPVRESRAMIDQVIDVSLPSSSGGVALHAARIGGGTAAAADLRGRGQSSFRPGRSDLDDMAALFQCVDGRFRHAVLDHEHARTCGARPERDREMFGVPGRRVDRFLQIHVGVDMPQEELRDPLILLVAAGRSPGEIRLAVAQGHGRRERGARALARREGRGMTFLEPEHLRAAAEAEAEFGDDRGGLQPAARGGGRDHVAGLVDDIEMHGVAAYLAEAPDRRLARAHRADRLAVALGAAQLDHGAETFDRSRREIERGLVRDELATLVIVGVRQQRGDGDFAELRIAIKFLAVGKGELGALDLQMDELRTRGIEPVELKSLEQREL